MLAVMLVVLLAVMLTVRIKPIFCYQTYSLSGSPPWTSWCQGPAAMPLHGVLPSPLPSQVHGQRVPHRREILTDLPGQEEGDPALPSLLLAGFGGTFGLFVGFSFLMFWDLLEVVARFFAQLWKLD